MKIANQPGKPTKFWLGIIIAAFLLIGGGILTLRTWYHHNLSPVSTSHKIQYFTVIPGSSVHQISSSLKEAGLVRSSQAFETYVRSRNFQNKLQAGTYALSPSMSVQQIADKIAKGEVSRKLLTILPGQRLDQIKKAFSKAGYSSAEIKSVFNPSNYQGHPALVSLPKNASLEGFLYPDSFQKQSNTSAQTIIRQSLDEMANHLSGDLIKSFAQNGLSVYEAVTLASIVAQETGNPTDQPTVAQVFYNRLSNSMPLGSDVTAYYAAFIMGQTKNLGADSAYNTRLYAGLPPGPISNVTASALKAVAHPAHTDYLYFLFGDDNKMHFSHTQAEHDAAIAKYCAKNCAF